MPIAMSQVASCPADTGRTMLLEDADPVAGSRHRVGGQPLDDHTERGPDGALVNDAAHHGTTGAVSSIRGGLLAATRTPAIL